MSDRVKWYKMCKVLNDNASSRAFSFLRSSEPRSLSGDETYWMERYFDGIDDSQDNVESSFLFIDDINGYYKLKIPLLMNPTDGKAICLLTLKELPEDYGVLLGDRDLRKSATQFLHFLRQFSALVGQLFPKDFVASCCYLERREDLIAGCRRQTRKDLLDETILNNLSCYILDKTQSLEELHQKIHSIKDSTASGVVSLADLCTIKLIMLNGQKQRSIRTTQNPRYHCKGIKQRKTRKGQGNPVLEGLWGRLHKGKNTGLRDGSRR